MFKGVAKFLLVLIAPIWSSVAMSGSVVALGVQEALQASDAAKVFQDSLLKETEPAERALRELDEKARELQVKAQAGNLSKTESDQNRLQFEKVVQQLQQQAESLQRQRAEREQAFIAEMRPKLDAVIRELIEEQGISVILNRQSTVYMEAGVDITPEVVKRLNAL